MMEFGLRLGLAQDLQYDQRINDLRYQNQLKKQATLEAQAKAKMFSDDFDFTNAMNEHDNPLVKEFAKNKIKEIGAFINQNPDWEMSVEKRGMYKQLIRELKDNKDLNRGIQSDQNIKLYNAYMADPKNNEMIETPEFKQRTLEYQNYLKYGNQYGEEAAKKEGKRAFMFSAPEEAVDYVNYLMQIAKSTAKHGTGGAAGMGGYRQFVTDADKQSALQMAKSHPMFKYIRKDYEKMSEEERKAVGSIDNFVMTKMQPYFPEDSIHVGQFFKPDSGGSGSGLNLSTAKNPLETALLHAKNPNNKSNIAQVGPQRIYDTFADKDGMFDLSQAYIVDQKSGNKTPMNLGAGRAQPYGNIKYIRNDKNTGYYVTPVRIRLPLTQFVEKFGNEAIDYDGSLGGVTVRTPSDETSFTIHNGDGWDKDYTGQYTKVTDEKGRNYIEFDAELPFQNNEIIAARFNSSVTGGKNADYYTSNQQNKVQIVEVSPDGTMGRDAEGNVYQLK